MIDASRRIYAQLTMLGWVNISREIAESGGLDVNLECEGIDKVFCYVEEGSTLDMYTLVWSIYTADGEDVTAENEYDHTGIASDYMKETLVDVEDVATEFPKLEDFWDDEQSYYERNFHLLAALPNSRKMA